MEQFGIFYYFDHSTQGQHTLVLCDSNASLPVCPGSPLSYDDITIWHVEQELETGQYSVTDYNFTTPSTSLLSGEQTLVSVSPNSNLEFFDYPGPHTTLDDARARTCPTDTRAVRWCQTVVERRSKKEPLMQVRLLTDPNSDGWTLAVPDGVDPSVVAHTPGRGIILPWCLKVDLLKTESGRDYFQILEGGQKGKRASIRRKDANTSFLTVENLHKAAGLVKLSRVKQQLWYGAQDPYSAFSELTNPVPAEFHDLEIPDLPHEDYYPESSKYQRVWFRIGHSGDRYLHLGTISHGCATVRPWLPRRPDGRFAGKGDAELGLPAANPTTPFARWDDICKDLMNRRKNDVSVGSLHVID